MRAATTLRTLHVVDVENLAGGSRLTTEDVQRIHRRYCAIARIAPSDQVVVASGRRAASSVMFGWPGNVCRKVRSGVDGADQELLNILTTSPVDRFDRVVIGSGDGAFALEASRLRHAGITVELVCRDEVSRASAMHYLDLPTEYVFPAAEPIAA
jgi:hypothetical protein